MSKCIHVDILEPSHAIRVDDIIGQLWHCSSDIGAVVAYVGRVKGENVELVLDVIDEEKALHELREAVETLVEKYPGLRGATLYTYRGVRKPGEPVAYIAAAAVDRRTAVEALAELVDRYKATRYLRHEERPLSR